MILLLITKLKREKNITFLFLLFILLGFDHFNTKNNLHINLKEQNHSEHQDGETPCGM
jgi:hypothetical protein